MARSLLTTLKAAVNHVSLDGQVPLLALEFSHPSITTIRVVHNNEDITSGGNVYVARPFDVKLLDERQGEIATTQINYHDIDLELIPLIRELPADDTLLVKGRLLLASEPDANQIPAWNWHILDSQWSFEARQLGLTLGPKAIRRTEFPRHKFSPDNFVAIFGGTQA